MKKLWMNIFIVFILFQIIGHMHHGYMLRPDYESLRSVGIYRSQDEISNRYIFIIIGQIMLSIAFVIIYRMGKELKPWFGQGVRYGFLVSILASIPNYLTYYSVEPVPGLLIVKQIILDTVMFLIIGVVLARLEDSGQTEAVSQVKEENFINAASA